MTWTNGEARTTHKTIYKITCGYARVHELSDRKDEWIWHGLATTSNYIIDNKYCSGPESCTRVLSMEKKASLLCALMPTAVMCNAYSSVRCIDANSSVMCVDAYSRVMGIDAYNCVMCIDAYSSVMCIDAYNSDVH